jgi:hypothetical protein
MPGKLPGFVGSVKAGPQVGRLRELVYKPFQLPAFNKHRYSERSEEINIFNKLRAFASFKVKEKKCCDGLTVGQQRWAGTRQNFN